MDLGVYNICRGLAYHIQFSAYILQCSLLSYNFCSTCLLTQYEGTHVNFETRLSHYKTCVIYIARWGGCLSKPIPINTFLAVMSGIHTISQNDNLAVDRKAGNLINNNQQIIHYM